jgi:N-methylhydantoinase A/oxoprolinase/acetone carboxylase beta subunit
MHVAGVRFHGRVLPSGFYRWEELEPGTVAAGPAVIVGGQATTVVPPGFSFRIDEFGNLVAVRPARRQVRRSAGAEAAVS